MVGSCKRRGARRSAEQWRELLAAFGDSGLGVEAFCRREAISVASFYRWRRLLGEGGQRGEGAPAQGTAEFVDLGALSASASPGARLEVKLDLGGGLIVHLVRS